MKTKKIVLAGLVVLLVTLFGWASAAQASYPPCRDVTIWIEATADGVSKRFCHSVTDPVLNKVMVGKSVEVFNNIDDFKVVDGVVIGVGNYNSSPSHKYVYLSVYDPALQGWREEGITDIGNTNYSGSSFPFGAYISCAGGVVAMSNSDYGLFTFTSTGKMWAKTYDPQRGQWQIFYLEDGEYSDTPYTKDGIAFFNYVGSEFFDVVHIFACAIYDPRDGIWHYMKTDINVPPWPTIDNATVYYTDTNGNPRHAGYYSGSWQIGKGTVPVPYFQIAPTTGPPPLNVWITDMSLGGTGWTTDFGEGAGPQNFRSGRHTFNSQGTYNVTQKVSNSFYPSGVSLAQAAKVLDITAPVGSIYIEPTPYGGLITYVGNAIYINTTDILLHYSATGMDSNSTMRFSPDQINWTSWLPYSSNIYEIYLPPGDGLKTVWAQFKDSSGNTGECSANVYLDTTSPVDGKVTATGGPAQVTLKWGWFSDVGSGIAFYKIYYSTTGFPAFNGVGGKLVGQTTSQSFVHRGLKGGTTYYYRVVAKDRLDHTSTGVTAQATTKGVTAPILQLLLLN